MKIFMSESTFGRSLIISKFWSLFFEYLITLIVCYILYVATCQLPAIIQVDRVHGCR